MSSMMSPVGPEDASTYWRRRAVLGVAALVVLWVLVLVARAALGAGEGDSKQASDSSPQPNPSVSTSPAPVPSASSSPTPTPSVSPVVAGAEEECAKADLEVAVATASPSARVGAGMGLTISIKNTGAVACTRDVGPGANELRVTSGSVLVWSSDFCSPSSKSDVEVIPPGEAFTASLAWAGDIVTESCPSNPPTAQPGTYRAIARNGELESEPATFLVK